MTRDGTSPATRRGPLRGGVARAATLLISLTAVSQLLGFVRDAVIAAVFGAGAELDAYLVAQGVMNLVLALVATALARAVVPPVSRAVAAGEGRRADRTVRTVLTLGTLVLVAGSVLAFLAAEQVVAVLAPGFDEQTAELTVRLTRIVLVAALFIAATDILAAACQAHGRFFASGLQGVPFNLVMIGAALWAGERFGIEALAAGFVVGSAVRMLVQLPAVRAAGMRLRPRLALRDPDVREVLRLTPPLLVGSAVLNVNTLVDRAVGSAQGEGVITALSLGFRVIHLVDALLVATVVAALYPAFSAVGAPDRRADLRALVDRTSRLLVALLLPVVAALVVLARPIVQFLYGRGDFDQAAVSATATAVAFSAAAVLGIALRSTTSRASLAVGDTRTPTLVALAAMVVNVAGDLTLGVAYGIPGLAASTSLSLVLAAALAVALLGRRHAAVTPRALLATTARGSVAAVAGGLVAAAVLVWGWGSGATGTLTAAAQIAAGASVGAVVYLAVLAALRGPELADLRGLVRRGVRRGAR
ncbi:murein biosynthesis integral membrane protein MurJ [Blastococcus sp. KM273128]|uniref:murein biosynthesis integral membrane protein MurJ n=1 Tax=Blastococcus sp. KM273128 TaxID=2570314 RepID=UPI001F0159BB|nr:murein biosynthesis integral membrane protein MurJ [Blastococcus sp. KM273128]MCF6743361.1 murein biosynthesis integral membrane protein MurJ [Blastococcus sp. KM273128]